MSQKHDNAAELLDKLRTFMDDEVKPREDEWDATAIARADGPWEVPPLLPELQGLAKARGLWNLFLPGDDGAGLTNVQYAALAECMGWVPWAAEVFNCSAPDTGNMELLAKYGTPEQRAKWLEPLLAGTIRSAFLMTEPDVASSDATNIRTTIRREGDSYVLNGTKWFATGVMDPRCAIWIVMGVSDADAPSHLRHSQVLVEPNAPGVEIARHLTVFGDAEAPHGHAEVRLTDVVVPAENLILGEGRGFEIAQGRLGPGRIHHAMRTIGIAERALSALCHRLAGRTAFGGRLSENALWEQRIGEARIDIDMARLLTIDAADRIDREGTRSARGQISAVKVAVPRMARRVTDMAIQGFGAAGLSGDHRLPSMYALARWVSIADGPDEVHNRAVARLELRRHGLT